MTRTREAIVEAFWRSAATRVVLDRLLCAKLNGRKLLDSQTTGRFEISKGGPQPSLYRHLWDVDAAKPRKKKKEEDYDIYSCNVH